MTDQLSRLTDALVDRYTIEREIGRGGMATVYLAQDLKHGRHVALKVLRPELAATVGSERFLREIRLVAKLNHPHILPLLDSGQAGDTLFYAMPLVEGESLRTRLKREGQLSLEELRRLVEDVGSALDYAHRQGVIHRDIKPENILFHHSEPMVADFGIALAVTEAGGERLTETGLSIGTPQYMSPEQVSGDKRVDARSDIYALGCVLYESLVGEPPFTGPSAMAVMARQVTDPVRPITTVRPDVPQPMIAAVTRALAKAPADRFDTAGQLAGALVAPEPEPKAPAPAAKPETARRRCIAVLPFANLSADPENEYFSDGITDDVMAQLSKVGAFRVISRTSTSRFRESALSLREIGEQLNADAILEGTVRKAGERVRVVAQLIDATHDTHLWSDTYDRQLTDVFGIQSEVALSIAEALEAKLSSGERRAIEKKPTDDLEAYDLYLLGRHHCNKRTAESLQQAIVYLEKAIERDAEYARAYAVLAEAYQFAGIGYAPIPSSEAFAKSKRMALRAIELDPSSAEAHAILSFVTLGCEWDPFGAEQIAQRAVALDPDYAPAHQWLAWCRVFQGEYAAAVDAWDRAVGLDPLSAVLITESGWPFGYVNLHEHALQRYRRALEIEPDFAMAHWDVGWAYQAMGKLDEAIEAYQRCLELSPDAPFAVAYVATAYLQSGHRDRAERILAELLERAQCAPGFGIYIAHVAEALGRQQMALEWLERAYADREMPLCFLQCRNLMPFATLRDHPQFESLLERIGIPPHNVERERARLLERIERGTVSRKPSVEPGADVPTPYRIGDEARDTSAGSEHQVKSIVVLPFENLSADSENEYFCDGLTEAIINTFTTLRGLKVVARTSAFSFKGKDADVREIGRRLDVQNVLEGSVQKAGDRLRITAQLIDVSSGYHLWSKRFDRTMDDIFAIQDEIALAIADNLQLDLLEADRGKLVKRHTDDAEAYNLYLKGRYFYRKYTRESLEKSIEYFELAAQNDPSFALPYAGMADTYVEYGFLGILPQRQALDTSKQMALKAIAMDASVGEAHTSLGIVYGLSEYDGESAAREHQRALALGPTNAEAHHHYAHFLAMHGRFDEAITEMRTALEFEPLSVSHHGCLGQTLYCARRTDEALRELKESIEIDPSYPIHYWFLGKTYLQKRMFDEAIAALEKSVTFPTTAVMAKSALGYAHALAGNTTRARQILGELLALAEHEPVDPVLIGQVHVGLDEPDQALDWLEKGYEERSMHLAGIGIESSFDRVRDHPRFIQLLRKMGLHD